MVSGYSYAFPCPSCPTGARAVLGLEQKLGFCLVTDIAIFARGVKINKMYHEGIWET